MKTAVSTHEIKICPENDFEGYHEEVAKDIKAVVSEAEAKEQEWFKQYEARTKVAKAYAQILEDVQQRLQVTPTATRGMKIPLWEKFNLTIAEATAYFEIGEQKLRDLVRRYPNKDFFLTNGVKVLIKRAKFEQFLNSLDSI